MGLSAEPASLLSRLEKVGFQVLSLYHNYDKRLK